MKKHSIYRSTKGYTNKEAAQRYVGPYRSMNPNHGTKDEVALEELADLFAKGYTVTLGDIAHAGNGGLVETTLLGLDFDNEMRVLNKEGKEITVKADDSLYITPDEAISMATEAGVAPAIVYSTFSDSPEHRKFRMIFALEEPVNEKGRPQVLAALMSVFQKCNVCLVDSKCSDSTRLFFGGKEILHKNLDSTLPVTIVSKAKKDFNRYINQTGKANKASSPTPTAEMKADKDFYYNTTPEIDCIKNRDAQGLRKLLKGKDFLSRFELDLDRPFPVEKLNASQFIGSLPLNEVLGIDTQTNCILPGHRDSDPSGFTGEHEGKYRYRCFGCGAFTDQDGKNGVRTYDLLALTMQFGKLPYREALLFLSEALNVTFQTEWQRNAKDELDYARQYMMTSSWEERFPLLSRTMKKRNKSFGLAIELLIYARDHVNHEAYALCGRPTFFLGQIEMSKVMRDKGMSGVSSSSCQRKLDDFRVWGFLIDAKDSDLKPEIVEKARELQEKRNKELGIDGKRQTFWIVPSFTIEKWEEIEQNILHGRKGGYRQTHRSSRQLYNLDPERAMEVYAQVDPSKASAATLKNEEKILKIAADLLVTKGFISEDDVKKNLRGFTDKKKNVLIINTMPRVMRELKLEKQRVNKDTRAEFSIPESYASRSVIYTPKKN